MISQKKINILGINVPRVSRRLILLIKELVEKGYSDKHICLITKSNQSYVNKLRNGKLQANTNLSSGETIQMTPEETKRLETLNKIISLPDLLSSGDSKEDIIYIHVLKFFGVSKKEVWDLYFHMSKKQLSGYWVKMDVDIRKFKSESIGVEFRDYLDLIIDEFL